MFTPPIHVDLNAKLGPSTCCTGNNSCIKNTGGGNVNINQNTSVTSSNTNQPLEDEDKAPVDPKKKPEKIQVAEATGKKSMIYNKKKKKLVAVNGKVSAEDNKTTISSYYTKNSAAYGAESMALISAFEGINFASMFQKGENFLVKMDVAIQNTFQRIQPIIDTIKTVFKQVAVTAKYFENKKIDAVISKMENLKLEEETTISQVKGKEEKNIEVIHNLFLLVIQKISGYFTKEKISLLHTRLTTIKTEALDEFTEIAHMMTTLTQKQAKEIIRIAQAIDSVWKKNNCESLLDTLSIMIKMEKEELINLAKI